MNSLAQLTDASLHSELKRLVGSSNTLTAQLLAHLGEVEARGIHRERACSSLYTYCIYELLMSEDEAQRRCRAARLARQFPLLLDMLAEASLHLTGLLLIGPHLTPENQAELLARARFRSKREIERLVAEVAPCRDVPSVIEPLHRAGALDSLVSSLDDQTTAGAVARPRCSWAAYVRSLAGPVRQLEAGLGAGQAPPRATEQETSFDERSAASDAANDLETGARTAALSSLPDDTEIDARTAAIGNPPGTAETRAGAAAIGYRPDDAVTRAGAAAIANRPDDAETGARTAAIEGMRGSNTPVAPRKLVQTAGLPPPPELRYKVQFTADQGYVDLLEEARNLLQHELPTRDLVEVQRRALELLVHKLRQRKHAARERPQPKAPQPANDGQPKTPQPSNDAHPSARMPPNDARLPAPMPPNDAHPSAPMPPNDARLPAPMPPNDARPSAPQPPNDAHLPAPMPPNDAHPPAPQPPNDAHPSAPQPPNDAHPPAPMLANDACPPTPDSSMRAVPPNASTRGGRPAARSSMHSRHIPAAVRRRVWQRDQARCTYVDSRGQRCREQSGLEFHHQHPHARGGPPGVENVTLRCRSHNALAAEQDFGREFIRDRRAR